MLRQALVRMLAASLALVFSVTALAAGDAAIELEPANNDVSDTASLQRGARNFMNYCSGCHSAKYVRFTTIASQLGISEDQLIDNLMFNADKPMATIERTLRDEDAVRWFGTSPPDLSNIPRSRGVDHIFNFLQSFYVDPDSPTGVDNVVLAGTSMPHVLWELQGYQKAVYVEHEVANGNGTELKFEGFEKLSDGNMSAEEFDSFVRDTVNFLDYISEPVQLKRRVIGIWVLLFLTVFLIISWMLKKEIWKDVPG
jgi:ubiquinol-cytochrome c reductase cytochrome c1 subunit